MAQRRLEAGGAAVPARGRVDHASDARDFVLPPDVEPVEVAEAIKAKCAVAEVRHTSAGTAPTWCWRRGQTVGWLCRQRWFKGLARVWSIAAGVFLIESLATFAVTAFCGI